MHVVIILISITLTGALKHVNDKEHKSVIFCHLPKYILFQFVDFGAHFSSKYS